MGQICILFSEDLWKISTFQWRESFLIWSPALFLLWFSLNLSLNRIGKWNGVPMDSKCSIWIIYLFFLFQESITHTITNSMPNSMTNSGLQTLASVASSNHINNLTNISGSHLSGLTGLPVGLGNSMSLGQAPQGQPIISISQSDNVTQVSI